MPNLCAWINNRSTLKLEMPGRNKKIHFLATEKHYLDHVAPIYRQLDKKIKGSIFTRPNLLERARAECIEAEPLEDLVRDQIVLVASFGDLRDIRKDNLGILCEHGAGQSYGGGSDNPFEAVKSPSYIGSIDRAGAIAVLVPGEYQAARHQKIHPTIPAYPIGVPKLDRWHRQELPKNGNTVAVTFHWECKICPETRSAFRHFQRSVYELKDKFNIIGHAHPKAQHQLRPFFLKHNIPFFEDFEEIIERAHLLCVDNSSVLYEWASLDRPILAMNAPWYRRDLDPPHGLRFWSHIPGLQVDEPQNLKKMVSTALADSKEIKKHRQQIMDEVFAVRDGSAAELACQAIEKIHSRWK